ncbi:MAG: DUF6516 family protein [Zoogloeaceae bacterium]|nr:DUF6516 family protein [Zoogloeaceae bacterium]
MKKAESILDRRVVIAENAFVEMRLWRVPEPVMGSARRLKYSLAYAVDGICVLRCDNERGKGDHRHIGEREETVGFSSVEKLIADFLADVRRWNDENRDS